MQKKLTLFLILIAVSFLGLFGFIFSNQAKKSSSDTAKPNILVSVLPQKQIVEKIAGEDFEVTVIIPPGFSPETYDPTPQDMKIISTADIYFRIGHIPFEILNLPKISEINQEILIVDTSINNELIMLEAHTHAHDHEEEHDEEDQNHDEEDHDEEDNDEEFHQEEIDPHNWLAPTMVKQQAEIIKNTLVELYPEKSSDFENNYAQLSVELDELHTLLVETFAPIQGKTMLVYHPAFGYLAHIYGFNQEHFQIEGKDPSITQLQAIIDEAKADDVKVIFVQKQFSTSSAEAIAENIGGSVVQVDPLDPDYLNNIKNIAKLVSENL